MIPEGFSNELKYSKHRSSKYKINHYQFNVSQQWYAAQSRIGIGEDKTQGFTLYNIGGGIDYSFSDKLMTHVNLQIQNVFNIRYLNLMSLYRKLNIPEPGSSIQLFIRIPFTS